MHAHVCQRGTGPRDKTKPPSDVRCTCPAVERRLAISAGSELADRSVAVLRADDTGLGRAALELLHDVVDVEVRAEVDAHVLVAVEERVAALAVFAERRAI